MQQGCEGSYYALIGAAPIGPGGGGAPGGGAPGAGGTGTGGGQPASPFSGFLPILMVFLLMMIVMSIFSGRKEKKRRAELLSSLKRHDKVRMAGGMLGIVTDVRDDEVVVKVDESTNTKIRFARDAVQVIVKPATVKDNNKSSAASEAEEETAYTP